ncbi:hypothetical protein DD595_25435 [Enterobacter cloacae complex sp. 4DZ3-17B2]|nr:hypothetical protein DD595_25435 [Enterobacter cloacae complex sp. 4DZ3-17B2]
MQMYMMYLMRKGLKMSRLEVCQNGWCTLCVTINWMHLCPVVLVQPLAMHLMHQIFVLWLCLAYMMLRSLCLLMKHRIQKIGWLPYAIRI